jgi:hypothetical protein
MAVNYCLWQEEGGIEPMVCNVGYTASISDSTLHYEEGWVYI